MKKQTALMVNEKFIGYSEWLEELKGAIRKARLRASVAVNSHVIILYWRIGRDILERQKNLGWGAKVIDRLAVDLLKEFPDSCGFSLLNLKYMRKFSETWSDEQFVQQVAAQLFWFHHCMVLDKLDNNESRLWYIQKAIEYGWSRDVLVHQIESKLMKRQGKSVTNFPKTLPSPQSDLAQQIVNGIRL